MIKTGLSHTSQLTVTEALTAASMGSGDMAVLATPAMMALMENAAMMAIAPHLDEGMTSVGAHIQSSHLRPTLPGETVTATATVTAVDDRRVEFSISASCNGKNLGEGTHTRFIVNKQRFLDRLHSQG